MQKKYKITNLEIPLHFKLDQFEGPLDLLLSLIEEQKMDITSISLAKVADQYLEYLKQKDKITLENLADFLTVASKLILVKSKALLPILEFSEEEEGEIKDLAQQLAQYKKFKDVAKKIQALANSSRVIFAREGFLGVSAFFYPPKDINAYDLKKAFVKVVTEIPIMEKLEEEMVREVITLEQKIDHLQQMLRQKVETSFAEIAANAVDKVEIIVSFLAMLELVKQKLIEVEQNDLFHDIKLRINQGKEVQVHESK